MMDKPLKFVLLPEDNADIVPEYRDFMEKSINECLNRRWAMIESMMLLYMMGTGFRPDQVELCEQVSSTEPNIIRWFIRPLPNAKTTEEGKADPCHVRLAHPD